LKKKFSTKQQHKVFFKTFGCRTNIVDTGIMKTNIKDFHIVNDEKSADIVVINSCTVTNGADTNVRTYINKINKLDNCPKIVLTGCASLTQGKTLFENDKIDKLFTPNHKENINNILSNKTNIYTSKDFSHIDNTIIDDFQDKTKAFVKIQEGCDFSCSYCIIPQVRGKSRSYEPSFILKQIKVLTDKGFSEFVLTGTNIGSYGQKDKNSLTKLLKQIHKIQGVKRVRFGSIEPSQITDEFKEILDEPWIAKHLHIALQHTSKTMLKIMNRKNNLKNDIKLFEFLSQKGFALGTDFIVGHPGETDKIWLEAKANFNILPLTHMHCFRYSPRQNTKSAELRINVDGKKAKQRLYELNEIINNNNYKFRQQKQPLKVHIEQKRGEFYEGFDQYYNKFMIKSKQNISKNWINTTTYEVKRDYNLGS